MARRNKPRAIAVAAAATLCLSACAITPTPESDALTPAEKAQAITLIANFMSNGDTGNVFSVSKVFGATLRETDHSFTGRDEFVVYRGFQKASPAFSASSMYWKRWERPRGAPPTASGTLYLVISPNFCLTPDGLRQAFGNHVALGNPVDKRANGTGKFAGLAIDKNRATVSFTDDGACVKSIDIWTLPAPKN